MKPTESESFTCEHVLVEADAPVYTNTGSIVGGTKEMTSNTVEVEVLVPNFTVKKEQRIKGEAGYTTAKLKAEVGQTVEYKITVSNTGGTTLKFGALKDPKCTNIMPAGETSLKPTESESFTCEHVLTSADKPVYTNVATIEGGGKEKTTPPVEVEVEEPSFSIHKEQRIAGEVGYTAAKLVSEVGKKVEYKIVVTNTGNTTLKFGALKDTKCSGILPAGETSLKPTESESFTCEHVLVEADAPVYTNTGSIVGGTKEMTSNTVEVEVLVPNFTVKKEQRIKGEAGYTTAKLKAEVGQTVEYKITVSNTGGTTLKFGALKDPKCTNIMPAGETSLKPTESESFTCEHVLTSADKPVYTNVATIEGGGKEKTTPPVEVEVEEPSFSIHKEQRIAGEVGYTAAKLVSEVGKKVEYKIVVTNTGNTTLKFGALKDTKCSGILPAGETTLKPTESESFTCEHVLVEADENPYTNTASIEANKETKTSNTVEVERPHHPVFTITKFQQINGSGKEFTTHSLVGSIGDVVNYELVVKNTGNTMLSFGDLTDTNCEGIAGGTTELKPGEEATFTCHHTINSVGDWVNEGTITGTPPGESPITHTSNQVVVYDALFTIEKQQRLTSSSPFTTLELSATLGQTVFYKIIVTNVTKETPLVFSALTDANCQNITGGPGSTPVAPGESTTYLCEHVLSALGQYTNEASIEGNEEAGRKTSNKVVVDVTPPNTPIPTPTPNQEVAPKQEVKAVCDISESAVTLHGVSGSKHNPFKVSVPSLGIKEVTFYVDGKKLKTLTAAHAVKGQFVVTVNPSKYRYGAHKVSVKTVMTNPLCANIARSGVFVRAHPARVTPKFTG